MKSLHGSDKADRRGLWIVFLGVDGVGKSSVIEEVKDQLEAEFDGALQFHFRPGFRKRDMARPPVTEPHSQAPRGVCMSLGKLLYWLADYWCGYLSAVGPALRRSKLVVFDRYFPDILVDPRRYRLPWALMTLARRLAAFIPQPDLYVLLDAPAEVVQHRKQEVPEAESRRQRAAYLRMFESLPCTLMVDATYPIDEVAAQVSSAASILLVRPATNSIEAPIFANL